ncbi:hypothetical protein [Acinetobacter sp. AG3]|uniref:hypothetical protein n=1 Tax=unclassified Acinetobacter TaxID=196816 RepID=UPI001EEFA573|nr:hypothetical protein [Acinetobacter sp. AG3]MCG7219518.1 hypothetical protein [Acinetobacter sp. AG3]
MKRKKILIISVLLISGCSSSTDAEKALKAAGYTDIQTHGRAFFSCSEDDTFATKFSATNSKGERISGAVCSSWLKGSTIRF